MKQLTLLFLILLFSRAYSQTEIRLYAGLKDYPGISVEQMYKGFGCEISGSFKRKEEKIEWHGPGTNRTDKSFINIAFKKYFGENKKSNFFVGCYVRLRSDNTYLVNPFDFTPERKIFVDTVGQPVTYATRTDKLSVGALVGYKWLIGKHFVIETNFGSGYAPYYVTTEKRFYNPDKSRGYEDEFFGDIGKISIYGHLIIGYRFGKRPKKTEV